ncbi:MAG: hypothetical protein ABH878_09960 [bacterium]
MLWQWFIIGVAVAAAAFYLSRLILRAFRRRGCPACTKFTLPTISTSEKTNTAATEKENS